MTETTEAGTATGTRPRHSALDDLQGIAAGVALAALSLMFLKQAGLVTGQAAGVALLLSYAFGWPVGPTLLALNLPFWALALRRMGLRFALKTLAAMAALTGLLELAPPLVTVGPTHPVAAAVIAGVCAGFALLAIFRHGASLGGVGVLAIWLQDATGFRAGWTQMLVDACVFAAALVVIDPVAAAISALGAAIMNLIIALNHRRDRYVAI